MEQSLEWFTLSTDLVNIELPTIPMKTRTQAISASTQLVTRLAIATLVGVAALPLLGAQTVLAQAANISPLEDLQTKDGGSDPFSNRSGSASSMFELMRRATMGNMQSVEEFSLEQKRNLNDAAAAYREAQKRRFEQNLGTKTTLPVVPAPNSTAPTGTVTP